VQNRALVVKENRRLLEQNNKNSCRQSTRSIVIGKAKGISYEGILEAQVKLDAEKAFVMKEKPTRKRKSSAAPVKKNT